MQICVGFNEKVNSTAVFLIKIHSSRVVSGFTGPSYKSSSRLRPHVCARARAPVYV